MTIDATPRYKVEIFWSKEDGCFIGNVPALRSCSAHGDTQAEALAQTLEAMRGFVEVCRDRGMPLTPELDDMGYGA